MRDDRLERVQLELPALAKTALLTGRNVADLVVEAGLMSREEVTKQLSPARLSGLETITAAIPVMHAAAAKILTDEEH